MGRPMLTLAEAVATLLLIEDLLPSTLVTATEAVARESLDPILEHLQTIKAHHIM